MKKFYFLLFTCISFLNVSANTDKYRLTLRGNPATSIVIGWNQISGNNAKVYYGTVDHGTDYSKYSNSKSPNRTVSYKGMDNTFVRLTGLTPNTAYYFVIKDSQSTSRRFWFKTAPADKSRLSFIAGGDSRNNRTPRKNANLLVSKLKPHAIMFGGDMTDNDTNSEWQNWFNDWQLTIAKDGRMFPLIATRGNHEDSNNSVYNLFDTQSSNIYYAITFGNNLVRIYTLNTEISISGNQTDWLKNDLDTNTNTDWKMAQYHKPMRPHTFFKFNGNSQYNNWANLFYEKGVRLVVECDAHTVKTTWPVKPSTSTGNDEGFIRDNKKGTVYVGEGCWGAPLRNNDDDKDWTRNSGRFNQFKWIFVDENKIETRTIKIDNANEVGEVSNTNTFQIPSNLDIWNPTNGKVVTIEKETSLGNSDEKNTLEIAISNGDDDVEEHRFGNLYKDSGDLELVYDFVNKFSYQKIGLRFRNIKLPKNATITNAYIQFTSEKENSDATELEISLHNVPNSPVFSNSNNVSDRTTFSSKVIWKPTPWTADQAGNAQRTPNLSTMLQQLVKLNSWKSGNSASFIIRGKGESLQNTNAKRSAYAYDKNPNKAAKLIIKYTVNKSSDICSGINEWQQNINYTSGDKVRYEGNLFEKIDSDWNFLGACGAIVQRNANSSIVNTPPIVSEKSFEIYPNPFTNNITISLKDEYTKKPISIELFDINGAKVFHTNFNNTKEITINPELTATGIYFLFVKQNNQLIKIQKLIKK